MINDEQKAFEKFYRSKDASTTLQKYRHGAYISPMVQIAFECWKQRTVIDTQKQLDVSPISVKRLQRRLERANGELSALIALHTGREAELNYHAGFSMGYVQARITVLEDWIDYALEKEKPNEEKPS